MKIVAAAIVSLVLIAATARAQEANGMQKSTTSLPSREDIRSVAPALDKYTEDRLLGDVWKRPDLGPRDRSIITLAALIARNQRIQMPPEF